MSDRTQQILTAATAQTPEQYLAPGSHASVIAGYDVQKKVLVKHLGSDLMAAVEYMLGGGIATSQMHPFSRGFVQIDTSDPFVYPSIDLRYNTNPLDLDITVDGLRFVRKIMATPVVAPLGWTEGSPGPSLTTDVQLKGFLASTQSTMFHSCCTNPMQPLAQGGVVDAKLKVFGTTNLRYECFGDIWTVIKGVIGLLTLALHHSFPAHTCNPPHMRSERRLLISLKPMLLLELYKRSSLAFKIHFMMVYLKPTIRIKWRRQNKFTCSGSSTEYWDMSKIKPLELQMNQHQAPYLPT